MKKAYLVLAVFHLFFYVSHAQMNASFTTTINSDCNGAPCEYSGPTILINEMMVSPNQGDGCMYTTAVGPSCSEWVELYNPNLCQPIDISCYYIANGVAEGGAAVRIPVGTVLPPGGFCIIRGLQANAVPSNLLVQNGGNVVELITGPAYPGICQSAGRFWLTNQGGWLGVYDDQGVVQDAIAWGDFGGTNVDIAPCLPAPGNGCNNTPMLCSFTDAPADRKEEVVIISSPVNGSTYARVSDGGTWSTALQVMTCGTCNAVCQQFTVTCTGTATINVTGGTAPYAFEWSGSVTQTTQTATGLCAGTYTCQVTDATGNVQLFSVTIEDLEPVLSLSVQDECCIDDPAVALLALPVPSGQATAVLSGNGVSGNMFDPQAAGAGVSEITYTYVDEAGCSNTITEAITVHALIPVFDAVVDCTWEVTVNAGPENTDYTYAWNFGGAELTGGTVHSFQFENPGSYPVTLTITDVLGCSNDVTQIIEIPYSNLVDFQVVTDPVMAGHPVAFENSLLMENATYEWSFGDGTIQQDVLDPEHTYQEPGTYSVLLTAIDANGCKHTVRRILVISEGVYLYVPNSFTPDGDEHNNDFEAAAIGMYAFEIRIFNRWGEPLFYSADPHFRWDGTYKGENCPDGTYTYVINYTPLTGPRSSITGHVNLLR